ncbi:uncharacterized protein LOC100595393 [Nomascus leucogenys]|uniref:uncharacterized protein LOC100595393 n=1 Tax=Nomascus leucogenys TaxID=61853 RepID=UPI00020AF46B|nr:uncharacterized protein LOC100595393 [Nomascus leucogenys]
MRGLEQMEIRGGRYLLQGEVLGHSALGAQPAQAAHGDAHELLELPTLLQRSAGRGPCASLRGCRITPATALLLLSHHLGAQRRSMQAAAAEAGSLGRGRLGEEPGSRESWSRSAPRRCPSQDAGNPVCRFRPQSRGGGDKKLQKAARAGSKSRGGKKPWRWQGQKAAVGGKMPGRRGTKIREKRRRAGEDKKPGKAATAGTKTRSGGGQKDAVAKSRGGRGQNTAAGKSGGGKKPRRRRKNPRRRG